MNELNLIEQISKFSLGDLNEQQAIEMFSQLVKQDKTYLLNGRYGGTIKHLFDAEILDADGNILERVI